MNLLVYYCACGRWKPNSAEICDFCHAERVAAAKRVHDRIRKPAQPGVVSYRPTEQAIIKGINANATRARRQRTRLQCLSRLENRAGKVLLALAFLIGWAIAIAIAVSVVRFVGWIS